MDIDRNTYDSIMGVINDAVKGAQQKIHKEFGIKTEIEVEWRTTKRIGEMKLGKEEPWKEFTGMIIIKGPEIN